MKRVLPILVTMVLVATTAVWAQGGPGRPGGRGAGGPMMGGPGMGGPGGPGMGGPGMGGPGGPGGPGPRFEHNLFPPELVLSNQIAIGLTEAQITQIKRMLSETHGRIIDLQVDLQRAAERLDGLIEPARIDEAAAITAAEQTMAIETQLKKAHLALLVRIKNLLTDEQQQKLAAMRPQPHQRPGGPDDPAR